MFKKLSILTFIIGLAFLGLGLWLRYTSPSFPITSPLSDPKTKQTPLDEYTFDNLSTRVYQASPIELVGVIDKQPEFTAYQFAYYSENKRITGQANLPTGYSQKKSPVVIMIRGFVDPNLYITGMGTKNAAAVFARHGYLTFAPDFAGFGDSDPEEANTFAARFQKPVNILDLIESIKHLDYTDAQNIFLWGHSNGGQIALSVLEISRQPYPTTLWAPVSKPFPYSILYYTDEFDDHGKALRRALAQFESQYDADLFSIHNYFSRINAPIQLHQGGQDDAVPLEWSNQLAATLESLQDPQERPQLDIIYYTYPQADHNLQPNWNTVIQRDLQFFAQFTRQETPLQSSSQ